MKTRIEKIQEILGTPADNAWGPFSQKALDLYKARKGKASSFADPKDIEAFRRCKTRGGSDQECFKVGDNGIGKWGDSTVKGTGPSCALPPDDWQAWTRPRGQKVLVRYKDKEVVCELKDTMPRKANITNGAIIDLNFDACQALGVTPPVMLEGVTWQWL